MSSINRDAMYPGWVIRALDCQHLVSRGNTSIVLRLRHGQGVKRPVRSANVWEYIGRNTYLCANDNSDALYQVDAVKTATIGKRPNGFLESNRGR